MLTHVSDMCKRQSYNNKCMYIKYYGIMVQSLSFYIMHIIMY